MLRDLPYHSKIVHGIAIHIIVLQSILLTATWTFSFAAEHQGNSGAGAGAIEVAQTWLEMLDARDYERSYAMMSRAMKAYWTLDAWREAIKSERLSGSRVTDRHLLESYVSPLNRGRQFADMKFQCAVEGGQADIIEGIRLTYEEGVWRVDGYVISPYVSAAE